MLGTAFNENQQPVVIIDGERVRPTALGVDSARNTFSSETGYSLAILVELHKRMAEREQAVIRAGQATVGALNQPRKAVVAVVAVDLLTFWQRRGRRAKRRPTAQTRLRA